MNCTSEAQALADARRSRRDAERSRSRSHVNHRERAAQELRDVLALADRDATRDELLAAIDDAAPRDLREVVATRAEDLRVDDLIVVDGLVYLVDGPVAPHNGRLVVHLVYDETARYHLPNNRYNAARITCRAGELVELFR